MTAVLEQMFAGHELLIIDAAGARCSGCGRVDDWLEHLGSIALTAMGAPVLPPLAVAVGDRRTPKGQRP